MKIAIAGKGGTGKTTLAAWLGDYLARKGKDVWLIDADSALSLGRASGLEVEMMPESLIAHKDLIEERIGAGLLNLNPEVGDIPEKLAVDVPVLGPSNEGVEPGRKRLLVMGGIATAGGGCACGANALLKAVLAHLMYETTDWIIVDLEAGVEHLGRGTVEKADAMVIVTEASLRSLETAAKVSDLAADLDLHQQILLVNRDDSMGELCQSLPEHLRNKLPESCLVFPEIAGLRERMRTSAAVLPLPEQQEIDRLMAKLLVKLKEQ